MDTFRLRVELAHTGPAPGWKLPVPLGWECLYDIPKSGINDQVREQFHKLLDSWLDEIQKAPDQHGSRMPCFFTVEFRGDTEDWRNTEEELAANTKKLIKDRLNQFVKNRSR